MVVDMKNAYSVKLVPLQKLRVDKSYQRAPNEPEIDHIVANFTESAFTPLLLGRRSNGILYIIDGQERWQAGLRLGIDEHWACIIEGTTPKYEAEIFLCVNRDRKGVSALDRFKAALKAREEAAVAVERIVTNAGLEIPIGRQSKGVWPEVVCVGALHNVWRAGVLPRVLSAINRNWAGVPQALSNTVINGTGEFYKRFGDVVDQSRLDHIMSHVSPEELLLAASVQYRMTGGGRYIGVCKELVAHYNVAKKIKGIRKLPGSKQLLWEGQNG